MLNLRNTYISFLFISLFLSGLWVELDRAGPVFIVPVGILIWSLFYKTDFYKRFGLSLTQPLLDLRLPKLSRSQASLIPTGVSLGAALLFPPLLYLLLTWGPEFPFWGDHDHHMGAGKASVEFWKTQIFFVLGFYWFWSYFLKNRLGFKLGKYRIHPALFLFAILVLWSLIPKAPRFFARYPGLVYSIEFPIMWLALVTKWDLPINAARLTSFLSLPCYLFVLRPFFLKKWPSEILLPFAAFFFFQKDVLYYFTSSYLEPWALIFLILSIEMLFAHALRAEAIATLAPLLIGLGAVTKEQMILVLPFVWFASNIQFFLKNTGGKIFSLLNGVFAALPFIVFLNFRKEMKIFRSAEFGNWDQVLTSDRIIEFMYRLEFQFWLPALLMFFGLLSGSLILTLQRRSLRLPLLSLLAGALFQVLFYFGDSHSIFWTGYTRFLLIPEAMALSVLWILGIEWGESLSQSKQLARKFWALTLGLFLVNVYPTVYSFWMATLPDTTRSFTEHYDAPNFFPIARLIHTAEEEDQLKQVQQILINNPRPGWSINSISTGYPNLHEKYHFFVAPRSLNAPQCECVEVKTAILLPLNHYTQLRSPDWLEQTPGGPQFDQRRTGDAKRLKIEKNCIARLKATCHKIYIQDHRNPMTGAREMTGVLAIGK